MVNINNVFDYFKHGVIGSNWGILVVNKSLFQCLFVLISSFLDYVFLTTLALTSRSRIFLVFLMRFLCSKNGLLHLVPYAASARERRPAPKPSLQPAVAGATKRRKHALFRAHVARTVLRRVASEARQKKEERKRSAACAWKTIMNPSFARCVLTVIFIWCSSSQMMCWGRI